MAVETTLFLVKPDGVQRGLSGEIVQRIERTGLQIVGLKLMQVSRDLASRHYAEHEGKPFYEGLLNYITSSPVIAAAVHGPDAISIVRRIMGATSPTEAGPGTIRGDLAVEIGRNLVHGSANAADAEREVALYFHDDELLHYDRAIQPWLTE